MTALVLVGLTATSAAAQGRGKSGKVPKGHLPPAGMCRVWQDGVPPGHQRPATSCAEAERQAARYGGRVIYGDDRNRGDRGRGRDRDRDDRTAGSGGGILDGILGPGGIGGRDRDDRGRTDERRPTREGRERTGTAIPRSQRDTGTSARISTVAADSGYRDGLAKGREDALAGRSYDLDRHEWYRSGDRGYATRYGSRAQYQSGYRNAFARGYAEAYRR